MERKLASIQRVNSVEPIAGADAIVKATVLGWELVVKKGEFQPGDLCVYMEVDSILPEKSEFEFLRARHFRIKTIKLRGQVSQGICFPLAMLPAGVPREEGADITEILGIRKYIAPVPAHLGGTMKGNFPGFLRKTDEVRIQAVPDVLERQRGKTFYVTEKLDGSSLTAYWKDGEFGVCTRNWELIETPDNGYWKAVRAADLETRLKSLGRNLGLQGELIGNGVQSNKYRLDKLEFRLFSIFDIDKQRFFDFLDFRHMADQLGLALVPVAWEQLTLDHAVPQLVELAKRPSLLNKEMPSEGLVFRAHVETHDPELGRLSFKILNPEFLLKYDE